MKPPLLPLWTALAPLFLTSLLTPVTTHGIQCPSPILYSTLELLDMLGRAHFAKKIWHAGHLHTLESATVRERSVARSRTCKWPACHFFGKVGTAKHVW